MMKINLDNYEIVSKIFFGANLKIIFRNMIDTTDRKVLELKEVVGFIDAASGSKAIQTLRRATCIERGSETRSYRVSNRAVETETAAVKGH